MDEETKEKVISLIQVSYNKAAAAMLLYCHFIIYDTLGKGKQGTLLQLSNCINNKEYAEEISKAFENKIMQKLIQENEKVKSLPKRLRRKACAVIVTEELDNPPEKDRKALWSQVV